MSRSKDRLVLVFLDHEKKNGTLNAEFSLVITTTVAGLTVTRLLVDDRSSCKDLNTDTFKQIRSLETISEFVQWRGSLDLQQFSNSPLHNGRSKVIAWKKSVMIYL